MRRIVPLALLTMALFPMVLFPMVLFSIALLCTFAGTASAQSGADQEKQRLVGTWKLVSSKWTTNNSKTTFDPLVGPHGTGFLVYTSDGHMCAELMNPDRPAWKDKLRPTDQEKVSDYDGFFA